MTGCRIGKVTPKDKKISLLHARERPYVHRSVGALASAICEDSLMVGFFVVHRDRSTTTGWSHDTGAGDPDFLGGCEVLAQNWKRKQMS